MNDKDIHEFVNFYRIRDIRPIHDRNSYQSFGYDVGRTASFYNDRDQMIEMEMPKRMFEELVRNDKEFERMCQLHRSEAMMRKEHPAIEEAYSKYCMLLELYK